MTPSRSRKCYFLAPTRDSPPDGAIRLGSIISIPELADEPLNIAPIPIDTNTMKIFEHNESNYSFTRDKHIDRHFGIWASFLIQILGIGGDVGVTASNDSTDDWTCQTLKTCWFTPTTEYVAQSLQDPVVKKYLVENKVWLKRTKIYMITGLKAAYGASSAVERARERGVNLHIGVDGTNSGVPVSVGPDLGLQQRDAEREAFDGADPFVFAFRLRQIKVTSRGEFEHKPHTGAAMLSLEAGTDRDNEPKIEIVVEGLEDVDANGEEFGLEDWNATDNIGPADETCVCAKAE